MNKGTAMRNGIGIIGATNVAINGIGRTRGSGRGSARVDTIRFLLLVVGVTFAAMPFLVSFSHFEGGSEGERSLASVLAASKVSPGPPPSYKYSLKNPPDDSPYRILHTVTSRFMVGQAPNATSAQSEIQRARYLLFETFCWPTVKYQTSMNFYWILLVDPGLDPSIIGGMKDLLSSKNHFPASNAFLVLTNNKTWASDGIGVENSTSYGVGLQPIAHEFRNGNLKILTGDTDYLLQALDTMDGNDKTEKPLLVIETLLDADDGLNNQAVEWIQDKAIQRTKEHWHAKEAAPQRSSPSVPPSLNTTWWLLCGTDHIEWHNREIFQVYDDMYAKKGISSGIAGLRKSPLFCTSAGFTRVGLTDTPAAGTDSGWGWGGGGGSSYSHMAFPKDGYTNHALAFYFPECSTTAVQNGNYSACWHREFPDEAFIIKSRSITSDSMDHLNVGRQKDYRDISWLNASDFPLLINDTTRMWDILQTNFSVVRNMAWETSVYMYEHRMSIIRQNRDSRCTPGFPCFKKAQLYLNKMERFLKKQALHYKTAAKKAAKKNAKRNATESDNDDLPYQAQNATRLSALVAKFHDKIAERKTKKLTERKKEQLAELKKKNNATQWGRSKSNEEGGQMQHNGKGLNTTKAHTNSQ